MILTIRLFGKFEVDYQGQPISGFESRKVEELFCYLLLNRDRPHPRETLASILWEANSTAQSKKNLRQALWQLQNALHNHDANAREPFLSIEADWLRLNPKAKFFLDVQVFEAAFVNARGLRGRELNADQLKALEDAVHLYQGDLLTGLYLDWCIYERERLQNMCIAMLDKLMDYCEAHGEYENGMSYGERILNFDRAREKTHRRLMRLHYFAGDRTGALRQYQQCENALREELDVKPSRRTKELYDLIVADRPLSTHTLEDQFHNSPWPLPEATGDMPKATTHLKRLQNILDSLQRDISADIESIESSLKSDS